MTGVCFCLTSGPFGYSPNPTTRTTWTCSEAHQRFARNTKEEAMSEAQERARKEAGRVMGEYLSEVVGCTDISDLTAEQFDIAIQAVIETYRDKMQEAAEPF